MYIKILNTRVNITHQFVTLALKQQNLFLQYVEVSDELIMESEVINEVNTVSTHSQNPDINTSSWVFLDVSTSNSSNNENEEKIEELHTSDLGTLNDSNSESDSISIISESEDLLSQEDVCVCSQQVEKVVNDNDKQIVCLKNLSQVTNDNLDYIQYIPSNFKIRIILFIMVTSICFVFLTFWIKNFITKDYRNNILKNEFFNSDMTFYDLLDEDTEYFCQNSSKTCDMHLKLPNDYQNLYNKYTNLDNSLADLVCTKNVYNNAIKKETNQNDNQNNIKENNQMRNTKHTHKTKSNYLNKKNNYLMKKAKYFKKLENEINKLETKLRRTCYRIMKFTNKINKKNKNDKQVKPINKNGDWYYKMHSGRSEIRYKEKLSDWIFDRSKMRTKLRGNNWYTSQANGREQARSTKKFNSKKFNFF